MPEPITREEFNQSLGRIHEKIDSISKTGNQIEISAQMMKESVNKMCDCLYGNGREGLISKMTKLFERVSLHTKLISILLFSTVGLAFYIIQTYLSRK